MLGNLSDMERRNRITLWSYTKTMNIIIPPFYTRETFQYDTHWMGLNYCLCFASVISIRHAPFFIVKDIMNMNSNSLVALQRCFGDTCIWVGYSKAGGMRCWRLPFGGASKSFGGLLSRSLCFQGYPNPFPYGCFEDNLSARS